MRPTECALAWQKSSQTSTSSIFAATQRTSGERRRKEDGKVFGEGTRAPIAISVFVKNPDAAEHGRIFFHDIGDYLDQKQKLAIIRDFGAVNGISNAERLGADHAR